MKYLGLAAASLCVLASCGGDNPAGPDDPGGTQPPPSQACRTYASARTIASAFHDGARYAASGTCAYSTETNELTCTDRYTEAPGGCGGTVLKTVTRFASVSDFVGEVSVVPPLVRSISTTTSASNLTCATTPEGSSTGTSTHTYSQGRLVKSWSSVFRRPPLGLPGPYTTTYTAWDASGRPITAYPPTIIMSYDNGARTATTVVSVRGADRVDRPFRIVSGYDVSGNLTSTVMTDPLVAGDFMRMTVDNTATARLCRE